MYYSIFRKERKVKVQLNVEVVRVEAKTKSLRNGFNNSKGSYTYTKYTFAINMSITYMTILQSRNIMFLI